jgi:hypothetical protein
MSCIGKGISDGCTNVAFSARQACGGINSIMIAQDDAVGHLFNMSRFSAVTALEFLQKMIEITDHDASNAVFAPRSEITDKGGCEIVIEILRTYQDPPVMIACLVVMKVLARNDDARRRLGAHGACEAVDDCLRVSLEDSKGFQEDNVELAISVCGAINNLMLKNPHNADRLAGHGLCELLVKILLKYKTNADVCFVACVTILKVCHRKVYQDQLIELQLKGVLKLLLSIHKQYGPLHDVVYDVLHEIKREKTFGSRLLKAFGMSSTRSKSVDQQKKKRRSSLREMLGMAKDKQGTLAADKNYEGIGPIFGRRFKQIPPEFEGIDSCVNDTAATCAPSMQFCNDVITTDYGEALNYRLTHLTEENFERPVVGIPDCRLPTPHIDCTPRPDRYYPEQDDYLDRIEVLQQLMEIGTIGEVEFEKKKEEILNEVEQKKIEDQRRQDLFDHHHQMIGVHCPDGQLPSSLQCLDIEEGDGNDDRRKMTRSIFACDDDAFEDQYHMDCCPPPDDQSINVGEGNEDLFEIQKEEKAASMGSRIHGYLFGDYSIFGRNAKHFGDGPADLHVDTHHKVQAPMNDPHDIV